MKTPPDKTITMTFGSHPNKNPLMRWKAHLTFPAGADAKTVLPFAIEDGEGTPVKSGVFELAGQKLKIRDGKSSMTYGAFVAGRHSTGLWLRLRGRDPIPGGLTFE